MHTITIMSKPDCHLCEVAVEVVRKVVAGHMAVLFEEIDITQNLELLEKYRDAIPVVLVDGVERFRGQVDPQTLGRIISEEWGGQLLGITYT